VPESRSGRTACSSMPPSTSCKSNLWRSHRSTRMDHSAVKLQLDLGKRSPVYGNLISTRECNGCGVKPELTSGPVQFGSTDAVDTTSLRLQRHKRLPATVAPLLIGSKTYRQRIQVLLSVAQPAAPNVCHTATNGPLHGDGVADLHRRLSHRKASLGAGTTRNEN